MQCQINTIQSELTRVHCTCTSNCSINLSSSKLQYYAFTLTEIKYTGSISTDIHLSEYIWHRDWTWYSGGEQVVLHDISLHWIEIECDPKTDYEQCLNQHRITTKSISTQNCPKLVWVLKYWITFWWNLCKNCSFCQFWGIFGGIHGMFAPRTITPCSR